MDEEIEKEKDIQEKIERGEDVTEHLNKLEEIANEWCVIYGYDIITDMDVIIKEI